MVAGRKIINIVASDQLLFGLCVYIIGFVLILSAGILTPVGEGVLRTLHKPPVLIAVYVLLVNLSSRLIILFDNRGDEGARGSARAISVLSHLGFLLMTAGIILSSLTRFEGTLVLAEGQSSGNEGVSYIEGSTYSAKYASRPSIEAAMIHVTPSFLRKGTRMWNVKALMSYKNRLSGQEKIIASSLLFPTPEDGLFFQVKDFGYAPRYQITSPSGNLYDEAYVLLKLFPPGAEDSFRLTVMPHTFYVKYYPDSSLIGEQKPTMTGEITKPVFKLRVAKNMDLILSSRSLAPDEKVYINPDYLSFVDVKKWAEITVIKDWGLYLILPGMFMVLAAVAGALYRRTGLLRMIRLPDKLL